MMLPMSDARALQILEQKGFVVLNVDMVRLALSCVGKSKYQRSAQPHQAPELVDCSSFTGWLYGRRGIEIPRLSIDQMTDPPGYYVPLSRIRPGDLLFSAGGANYYAQGGNPADRVGHVGIYVGNNRVVHAANSAKGVVECDAGEFTQNKRFRGIRRCIPEYKQVLTLQIPKGRTIRTGKDVMWTILRALSRKRA